MALGVIVMARRKVTRHPVSGAPGVGVKRSAGAPSLNPITRPHGYLDASVRKREIEEFDNNLALFFSNQAAVDAWSQPVRPINGGAS